MLYKAKACFALKHAEAEQAPHRSEGMTGRESAPASVAPKEATAHHETMIYYAKTCLAASKSKLWEGMCLQSGMKAKAYGS